MGAVRTASGTKSARHAGNAVGGMAIGQHLGPMRIKRSAPVSDACFGVSLDLGRGIAVVSACLLLANCASSGLSSRVDPKYGVSSSPRVVAMGDSVPKGGGTYRVGKPYTVAGQLYIPEENVNYRQEGWASWYGDDFHGRLTANGEVFDMTSLSAAHPTLPMPCYARVTNLANGRSLIVRVNDRGPYHANRVMDVSSRAADLLEFKNNGVARVRVEYVGRAPLEGSDDHLLMATLRTGEPAPAPSLVRVASARPFVPDMHGSSRPIRGEVPLPEGRPYNLGSTQAEQGYVDRDRTAYLRSHSSDQFQDESRTAYDETQDRYVTRPVSAYAPVDQRLPSEILSGRGLY